MAESTFAEEDLDLSPKNQQEADNFNDKKLTDKELKDLKEDRTDIHQLANERMRLKAQAEAEIKELATATASKSPVIDNKEQLDLIRELNATDSPEETQKILDKIRDLPKLKEQQAEKDKDDARELPPNDPKLLELKKQFDKICDDNHELIGEGQVDGFKAWFQEEMRKKPTQGHLKEQIKKLEGKDIEDKNGLAPRRKEYAKLTELFKKYGISSPQENAYIKREGLSERQEFRKKIETLEDHFSKLKDTGFYSPEKIKEMMRDNLKETNPEKIATNLQEAKDISRKEAEAFTHMDERITVGGVSLRKMSEESKKKYMEYYRELSIKDRKGEVGNWQILVDNEGGLAKHSDKFSKMYADNGVQALDQIYKDDPEALRLAAQSFEHLDFMQKVDALKKHATLAKNAKNREKLQKNLILQGVNAKLEVTTGKHTVSEKTRDRYREFFENPNNFKNPDTKQPGDIKELKKAYDIFISPTPDEKHKNLAAYEKRRKDFGKDLAKLQEINPAITDEDLKKWQDKYDREGWTKREQIHKEELAPKISKENEERKKRLALEEKAGMKEKDKKEKKNEGAPGLAETITAVTELMANDQGAEAMKKLLEFNETNPDNPKILFWMQTVANYMKEFGSGKKREATIDKELEQEMEKAMSTDKGTQDELLEQQIKTLQMEGVHQSEERHNKTISAQERARKESMGRVQGHGLEADLTADAYKQLGKDFRVDKKGKAKKIETIQFKDNNLKMQEQDRFRMKRETFKEQINLDKKEGMFTTMKDKQGNVIAHEVAAKLQQAELEKMEKEMAEKAQKKVDSRITSNDSQGAKIFDLNTRIAARRKAKELIDKKRHERLRAA